MLTGNKGEWSEIYVLLRLLADGRIYAANSQVQKLKDIYFPILKIFRDGGWNNKNVSYTISDSIKSIDIYLDDKPIGTISRDKLAQEANQLYLFLMQQGQRAFSVSETESFMQQIYTDKLKAPSSDKKDISMQVHDIRTGYEPICGFSIKSEIGSLPTLLNASKHTNFCYEVSGLSDADIVRINAINTRTKIKERMAAILEKGDISYCGMVSDTFQRNLRMIDTCFPKVMGTALLYRFTSELRNCKEIVNRLEKDDPLQYGSEGLYRFKFKSFLRSIALGMIPGTAWNGIDEANGGYIIVKEDGEVLAYHIYNRDSFEKYLLNNTKFETASTSRNDFASLYKANDKVYIKLNLSIRFI